MKNIFVASLALLSATAAASPARSYPTLAEALANDAHFNCSGTTPSGAQAHFHFQKDGNSFGSVQLVNLVPGRSVFVLELGHSLTPRSLTVEQTNGSATFAGEYDNADYFTARFTATLRNGADGIRGEFSFDDGDGIRFSSTNLKCTALNHISILN